MPLLSFGQVIISSTQLPVGEINLDKSFSVQLNNTLSNPLPGYLAIKYLEKGKQLAEITYQQIQLNTGITIVNTVEMAKTSEKITDNVLKLSRVLNKGEVLMCIDFIGVIDNISLGSQCNTIVLSSSENDSTKNHKKFKLPATFSGYAEISGSYSNRKGSYQELPANYTNVIINPELEMFGIPLGARFNYSTASDKRQQNMNLFSVYFDAEQFRKKMNKRYATNKAADYVLKETELTDYKQKTIELKKVNGILNNPYVKNELGKLNTFDSLTKLIQDSASYLTPTRLSELKSQKDSLSYLESKRDGYTSLLQKQKNLSSVLDIYNNPLETSLLKDSLDKLAVKLENTRNPFSDGDEKQLNQLDSLLGDNKISKQRREVLKKQRDALAERKKAKGDYENLKEQYAQLHHTYQYKSKLDSLRGERKGNLTSKDSLESIVNKNGGKLLKGKVAMLQAVKSFNVGFFAPYTGELTMNGVPLRGVGAELEFKKFFVNVAGGKLQRATPVGKINSSPTPFSRSLYTAAIGIGNPAGNFISVQYIDAKDVASTPVAADGTTSFFTNKSGYNQIIAAKFRKSFFSNKTTIEGEAAGSQLTNTTTIIGETIGPKVYTADSWWTNIANQTVGSDFRTGYAYNISLKQQLNKGNTQIQLSSKRIMSSFISFGSPFLLSDINISESKITQQLWKGKVTVAGFYRVNSDNLDNLKTFTTKSQNFGGDVSVRIPKWPSLRVAYTPIIQQTQNNYFNATMLLANSAYGIRKGSYYHQWSAIYMNQKSTSRLGYNNFTSENYTASYLLAIRQHFTTSINLSYIKQQATSKLEGLNGGVTIGYRVRAINQTAGVVLADNNLGNRRTYFYELTSSISQYLMLRFRYDYTNYLDNEILLVNDTYKENLLVFSVISKW